MEPGCVAVGAVGALGSLFCDSGVVSFFLLLALGLRVKYPGRYSAMIPSCVGGGVGGGGGPGSSGFFGWACVGAGEGGSGNGDASS